MSVPPSPVLDGEQKQDAYEQATGPDDSGSLDAMNSGDDHHKLPGPDNENPVDYSRGSNISASIPPKPDVEPPVLREKQVKVLRSSLLLSLSSTLVLFHGKTNKPVSQLEPGKEYTRNTNIII